MTIVRPSTGWKIERIATHPGAVLREDFLEPLRFTADDLAVRMRIPAGRVEEVLGERVGLSPELALRLSRLFGTAPEFWLNLQAAHDLSKARVELKSTLEDEIEPLKLEPSSA
jgi:addiction module HigA family antidote